MEKKKDHWACRFEASSLEGPILQRWEPCGASYPRLCQSWGWLLPTPTYGPAPGQGPLLLLRCFLPGLLLGVTVTPFSVFLPLTNLCYGLIVYKKPSDLWIECWLCFLYLQSWDSHRASLLSTSTNTLIARVQPEFTSLRGNYIPKRSKVSHKHWLLTLHWELWECPTSLFVEWEWARLPLPAALRPWREDLTQRVWLSLLPVSLCRSETLEKSILNHLRSRLWASDFLP